MYFFPSWTTPYTLNIDLKSLNQWLLAKKISSNATKSQLIYFRSKRTPIPNVKIKLNGIKLFSTDHIKYVGITFNEDLTFQRSERGVQNFCHVNLNSTTPPTGHTKHTTIKQNYQNCHQKSILKISEQDLEEWLLYGTVCEMLVCKVQSAL